MPTPADLRRKAAELRARAQELLELADRMDADQARAEALTGRRTEPITKRMHPTVSPAVHAGPKITSDGPVSKLALALGMSMPEIAREIGVKYMTLKTMNHRGRLRPDVQEALDALVKKRTPKK